jgi:hypothetical protein
VAAARAMAIILLLPYRLCSPLFTHPQRGKERRRRRRRPETHDEQHPPHLFNFVPK